jgi:hypothetical protein
MSGEKPIGDVVGSKSQRQLWNRAADGRRVRRQLLLLADAAERVAVATVRSCYGTAVHRTSPEPPQWVVSRRIGNQKAAVREIFRPMTGNQSIAEAVAPSFEQQLWRRGSALHSISASVRTKPYTSRSPSLSLNSLFCRIGFSSGRGAQSGAAGASFTCSGPWAMLACRRR